MIFCFENFCFLDDRELSKEAGWLAGTRKERPAPDRGGICNMLDRTETFVWVVPPTVVRRRAVLCEGKSEHAARGQRPIVDAALDA